MLSGMYSYADFETGFTKWMSDHSFGLYAIISRIPFFRWAVLGIKKKESRQ